MPARLSALALALAALSLPSAAQSRWSAEARAGAAFATDKLADADLGTGIGFDATVRFRVQPHLFAYLGWGWMHFTDDATLTTTESDVEETGYVYGLRFQHPMRDRVELWLRAGGTFNHIEIEDGNGEIVADTKHGAGWELGAGLAMRFRDQWQFTPGIRYRALERDLEIGAVTRSATLNYLAVSVGFARLF